MGMGDAAATRPGRRELQTGRPGSLLATAVFVCAVLGLTLWRLRLGLDLTDESFSVAAPYHYTLGAVPFVDETTAPAVTSSILTYPFVAAWTALNGLDGLVLFMRVVQFLISLLVAGVIAVCLRGLLRGFVTVIVGLAAVAFVPFNVHAVGYDTLTFYLLTCGLFLAFDAARRDSTRELCAAAACAGLATFVYPPLVAPVLVTIAAWLALSGGPRRRALALSPALLVPVAGFGALALVVGTHPIISDYTDTARYFGQAGGPGKLWSVVTQWLDTLSPSIDSTAGSMQLVGHLGLLALPLYFLVRHRAQARMLLLGVWLPSLLAALTIAYASTNGEIIFGLGLLPGFIVAIVFVAWLLETPTLGFAAAAVAVGLLMACGFAVYRDGPIGTLTARVTGGAFSGILTTPAHREFVDRLQSDLSRLGPRCRILFFDHLPAGYLMSAASPDANSLWTQAVPPDRIDGYRRALLSYYRTAGFPDLVVMMLRSTSGESVGPEKEPYIASDPLIALLHRRYRLTVRREDYAIYTRGSGTCPAPG